MSDESTRVRFGRRRGDILVVVVLGIIAAATVYAMWPGQVLYSTSVANFTDKGVIIYPAQCFKEGENKESAERRWRINSGIPGAADDTERIPPPKLFGVPHASRSNGNSFEMPEELVIGWQRADLTNCEKKRKSSGYKTVEGRKVTLDDGVTYTRRRGCDWEPHGPIREFSISRSAIQSREAYQKVQEAHYG